jgi:hypothetical protein
MSATPAEAQLDSPGGTVTPGHIGQEITRQTPLPSDQLLRGRRIVEIAHNGEVYRLQSTRLGKLILTK